MSITKDLLQKNSGYKYGFFTEVETDSIPKGLSEETIYLISKKKDEPEFILKFRLKAFHKWMKSKEPSWCSAHYKPIDYQNIKYFSSPKKKNKLGSLKEVDPEVLKTFDRLGIPIEEQKILSNVAVDMVFDSVSVGVTFQNKLRESGVILCSISEAMQKYPELVEKYLGSVVPIGDNYFATLNAAVFTDGSFVFIPKGVHCPMELSTYFRMNDQDSGQFERTLIIAEDDSYVSYLEGCTAPAHKTHQLHAAVVELIANKNSEIKYSTVQNWYAGDNSSKEGGIYNFVTKRGLCHDRAKISWTQVEVGSAITWKYPSCILKGDNSVGEFYSIALTCGEMQADTGSKMIHLGKNSRSTIISKGIASDNSSNTYRGLVKMTPKAAGARNYTQCDSMIVGSECQVNTFPTIEMTNKTSIVEHEASTSKMNFEQLFYMQSRGIEKEEAINLIVNGFGRDVIEQLPLEFSYEVQQLLTLKLENAIG